MTHFNLTCFFQCIQRVNQVRIPRHNANLTARSKNPFSLLNPVLRNLKILAERDFDTSIEHMLLVSIAMIIQPISLNVIWWVNRSADSHSRLTSQRYRNVRLRRPAAQKRANADLTAVACRLVSAQACSSTSRSTASSSAAIF